MRIGDDYLITNRLAMAKQQPILNGGANSVDASEDDAATMAVIQDQINTCTKLQDGTYSIKEERFSCDFDHMYAMAEHDNAAAVMEVRQLKELLLLHLDLIQQQSEQIVNKDKQLQNLRQENEMLRQRLERMDRRVTLHQNKRNSAEPQVGPSVSITDESESLTGGDQSAPEEDSLQPFPKSEGSPSPRGSPLTLSPIKSHLSLPETRTSRSRKSSLSSDTGTAASRSSERGRDSRSRSGAESPTYSAPISKRIRSSLNRRQTLECEVVSPLPPVIETGESSREVRRLKIATPRSYKKTPVLYYCPSAAEDDFKTEPDAVLAQSLLEVPSWRIKQYSSCYSMEGTENLEDEVFLKRHQRLELDERRRKRWDIQRLREQRQYEKLKQRQCQQGAGVSNRKTCSASTSAKQKNVQQEEVSQLTPDIDSLQYIEVADFLPVCAFGVPVPAFVPMPFELPWVSDLRSCETIEIKQEAETSSSSTAGCSTSIAPKAKSTPSTSRLSLTRSRSKVLSSTEKRRTSSRRR